MTAFAQFVTMLPPEARAVVDDFAAKLSPLSWPDRSLAFEALWNDVVLSRGDASPAPIWQGIMTGAFERMRITKIRNVDAAAWAFLSMHPEWRRSAEQFLRQHAAAFVTWSNAHPLHEVIAEAIDKDAGSAAPAMVA